jgi:hypothetical protein
MKQIISFKKDIPFNTKIGEITSISLEHDLKMVESDHVAGEFIVSGDYKITDVSINREPFSYNLPFDISLDTKYNVSNAKIDIDDFYYEIINDQIMNVNIDVMIDGIEIINDFNVEKEALEVDGEITPTKEIEEAALEEVRASVDTDGINNIEEDTMNNDDIDYNSFDDLRDKKIMNLFKEVETPPIDLTIENNISNDDKIKSLFDSFDDKNESFTTYHVHIVRENDSVESIALKYKTTKEEMSMYNKLDELKIGDKIIIPASINE